MYNVEILGDDGNLHEATVDAASGDVLGSETEGRDGAEYKSGIDNSSVPDSRRDSRGGVREEAPPRRPDKWFPPPHTEAGV